jgi:hypothetical protein
LARPLEAALRELLPRPGRGPVGAPLDRHAAQGSRAPGWADRRPQDVSEYLAAARGPAVGAGRLRLRRGRDGRRRRVGGDVRRRPCAAPGGGARTGGAAPGCEPFNARR